MRGDFGFGRVDVHVKLYALWTLRSGSNDAIYAVIAIIGVSRQCDAAADTQFLLSTAVVMSQSCHGDPRNTSSPAVQTPSPQCTGRADAP